MKRIICLILCILMSLFAMVGCSENEFGAFLDELMGLVPEGRKDVVLDFYIVVGDKTSENAIKTVELAINAKLKEMFKTELDMHYVNAEDYDEVVVQAVNAEGEERADIVLITSAHMFDSLLESDKLAQINDFFNPKYSKNYDFDIPELKSIVSSTLLSASQVTEEKLESNSVINVNNSYCVPNNQIVGQYEYVLIHKKAAQFVNYGDLSMLNAIVDVNYSVEGDDVAPVALYANNLKEALEANKDAIKSALGDEYAEGQLFFEANGSYGDKAMWESKGYICNIKKYPIATKEQALSSAFAVIKEDNDTRRQDALKPVDKDALVDRSYMDHYERCMEVIWAFNSDEYLRNLLMYGVQNTNYTIVDENADFYTVERECDQEYTGEGENPLAYDMSIIHTGTILNAYYCDALDWNETNRKNGELQNKDSIYINE